MDAAVLLPRIATVYLTGKRRNLPGDKILSELGDILGNATWDALKALGRAQLIGKLNLATPGGITDAHVADWARLDLGFKTSLLAVADQWAVPAAPVLVATP
jgi:hypothetical protein